jgi:hypothetical protein
MTTYSGTLIYTLSPSPGSSPSTYPIINNDGQFTTLTYHSSTSNNVTTISIDYEFVDNGTTNDGFSFVNVNADYNIINSTITITQFGGIPFSRNSAQFSGLNVSLVFSSSDSPILLSGTSLAYAFAGSSHFDSNINFIDTTNVTSMSAMFISATSYNNGSQALQIKTDNCLDLGNMFYGATSFNQTIQSTGGYWNTQYVTNFTSMFDGATSFNNGGNPLLLYTDAATSMATMFQNTALFNQPIQANNGYWNTTNCTNMFNIFYGAGSFNNGGVYMNINISNAYYNGGLPYTNIPDGFSSGAPLTFQFSPFNILHSGTLIYTLTPDPGSPPTTYPIIQSTCFTNVTYHSSTTNNVMTISIDYEFLDDGTSGDGFSFANVQSDYNTINSTITITQFGGIPLSRSGVQFSGLSVPLVFSTMDSPLILSATSFGNAFAGSTQFNSNINFIDTTNVTNFSNMFNSATSFNNGGEPLQLKTDNCLDFGNMFYGATSFDQTIQSTGGFWNNSLVTNFTSMFYGATSFNNGGNPLLLKTDAATTFNSMFAGAQSFDQTIQSANGYWNSNLVTDFTSMFVNASVYNNGGNSLLLYTDAATSFSYMLQGAESFNQTIQSVNGYWNSNLVTNFSNMFYYASAYNNGGNPLLLNTDSATNMSSMFAYASAFNQPIQYANGYWNTNSVINFNSMFLAATNYNNGGDPLQLKTDAAITFNSMFAQANAFNQTIQSANGYWNSSLVVDFASMFSGTIYFNNGGNPLLLKTDSATTFNSMFAYATAFNQTIQSANGYWNSSLVTDFTSMFSGTIYYNNGGNPLQLNTDSATTFNSMFASATRFNQTIQTANGYWNSALVTDFSYMFNGTIYYNNGGNPLQLNTDSATTFQYMFAYATAFNQTIQSANGYWNSSLVTDFTSMFSGTTSFNNGGNALLLYTDAATSLSAMFQNATAFNQPIQASNGYWNTTNCTNMVNIFDGATSFNNGGVFMNINVSNAYNNGGVPYTSIPDGFSNGAPLTFQLSPFYSASPSVTCFIEGTQILTIHGYKPIEELTKGDLIKTTYRDYQPIFAIGKGTITHYCNPTRVKNQLYQYHSPTMDDLIITGCHCVLVDQFKDEEQKESAKRINNGRLFITDNKYRLPACVDERSFIYPIPGTYTIYHIALEHTDYYMNYGIYANDILVETCSKRYITEYSGLELLEQ